MLEAETEAGDYWKKCGDDALAHNIKGVVIMVSLRQLLALAAILSVVKRLRNGTKTDRYTRELTGLVSETRSKLPQTQIQAKVPALL